MVGVRFTLRFFALREGASADLSLQELEVRAFQSLPPQAREITSYLALSPRPLSLKDLLTLVGAEQGPEAVAEQVSTASGLLRQIRGQVMLVHEHLRTTILDQLHQASARLAFFANHLGQFFENSERYLAAFHVYFEADEHRHADRVLERAANQAVLMGGGAPAIPRIPPTGRSRSGERRPRKAAVCASGTSIRVQANRC